jgi:hypothetical protein
LRDYRGYGERWRWFVVSCQAGKPENARTRLLSALALIPAVALGMQALVRYCSSAGYFVGVIR